MRLLRFRGGSWNTYCSIRVGSGILKWYFLKGTLDVVLRLRTKRYSLGRDMLLMPQTSKGVYLKGTLGVAFEASMERCPIRRGKYLILAIDASC